MRTLRLLVHVGLLAAFLPLAAAAQELAAGRLLVATSELPDASFHRSVVLLLDYDSEGATGVLINRPTWVKAADAYPELDYLAAYPGHVYFGGPLAHTTLSALVRSRGGSGLERVADGVYLGTSAEALRAIVAGGPDERELRLYAGLASWAPSQLEREVRRGYWRVVRANPDLVFAAEPHELWHTVIESGPELVVAVSAR